MILDNKITHHERKVYTLFELIGDLGGVNQIIVTLFSIFMDYFVSKLYEYETVSEFTQCKSAVSINEEASENKLSKSKAKVEEHDSMSPPKPIQKTIELGKSINKIISSQVINEPSQRQLSNQQSQLIGMQDHAF